MSETRMRFTERLNTHAPLLVGAAVAVSAMGGVVLAVLAVSAYFQI